MKSLIILFFVFVALSLGVNAISVVSDYLENNTMILTVGESKIYSIRLQNPTNNEAGIKLDYDNNTMKVLGYYGIYTLAPKETGYRINFNVTAPKQPGLYTVGYTVSEVEAGGGGGVPIRLKINRNFTMKVIKKPGFYWTSEYKAYITLASVFIIYAALYFFWNKNSGKRSKRKH